MALRPEDLKSDMAKYGQPVFFPEAPDRSAYNFDQGLAAPETFPHADLVRLGRKVLDEDAACLDYFTPAVGYEEITFGNRALRDQLTARIERMQGRKIPAEGLILTSGSVQALALAINAYINSGDIIATEAISFPYATRYMHEAGADVRPVPMDWNGMDVDALEALIGALRRENKRLKMVYTGPTFHCPTGAVMSLERRRKLVALSQEHEFIVLEDDVYSDLRFGGERLPSLFSLDDSGFVLQAGTFSKMVAPGLRLGWMAGEPKAIEPLASVRQDLGVSQWISRIMEEYLVEGLLEPHLVKVNTIYRTKRDAAVEGLRAEAGDLIRFEVPQGSFYLWIEIDDRVDWERAQAEASRANIFFRPGERFLTAEDKRKFFRMAFSHAPLETVREGAKKIGQIIRASALTGAVA